MTQKDFGKIVKNFLDSLNLSDLFEDSRDEESQQQENLDNANHIHDYGLYIGNHPELDKTEIIKLCRKLNEL